VTLWLLAVVVVLCLSSGAALVVGALATGNSPFARFRAWRHARFMKKRARKLVRLIKRNGRKFGIKIYFRPNGMPYDAGLYGVTGVVSYGPDPLVDPPLGVSVYGNNVRNHWAEAERDAQPDVHDGLSTHGTSSLL
jgi:hypothetical protein